MRHTHPARSGASALVKIPTDYLIHDFLEFNPSGTEAGERRELRAIAGRLGGLRSGETRRNTADRSKSRSKCFAFA